MNCLHCGATTNNGLALCALCQRKAATDLEFLPVYFRNLARWRPGRAGSRPVPGSRVLYDGTVRGSGTGDRISDALDETGNALTTWARLLVKDRGDYPRPLTFANAALCGELPDEMLDDDKPLVMTWLCAGLEHHLTSVATLDWCGEFARDLGIHEAKLRALTEAWMPGWYAGACRRCEVSTYVTPGLTWVTCSGCGATTYARDHLDVVIAEASDWLARPKALAEAIVALVDTEPSVSRLYTRIRQWAFVGDITGIRRTTRDYEYLADEERFAVVDQETGPARYRLGDVLDRVFARDTRAANGAKTARVS
jgi:hypothetical protein